ncbi:hypothetical protein SAMN04488074_104100 [Lentzea albidocapillata subsp. violacea]|uniref:Sporulation and spore germination n=1 Tax=Lentzea albidocapillata subsp. violacea TaxID=128104 RepID=A0A1G8YN67_9PSEU|nr:hypothetical protein [Lentzea albidocapillata]SDK04203.1 hypothetical protein SAMN04488074_104100 [Lentzea albidocapillata subsp. violacea]
MKRIWPVVALLVAGCGVQPSGVDDGGEAPTGVAPGVTLYFVDARGELQPQLRETGRLGTVSEALNLLLLGPGGSNLRTEIAPVSTPRVVVTTAPDVIRLLVPLAADEVTPRGIGQIVCTTLGVHVQSGGARDMKVQIRFTQTTPESDVERTCPLIR